MEGVTGLNYAAVISVIKLHERKKQKRIDLLDEIHAIESGFLTAIREKKK